MADGSAESLTKVAPALGISMNVQVDGVRQLVFQTHVDRDEPQSVLNAALDKISRAADRQVAKYMLISLRKELRQHETTLADMTKDLARVQADTMAAWEASGKRGPYKPDAKEKAAKANIEINAEKYRTGIEDIKARIAEQEAKVADTA